jgi:L-alanine-DL-glutamate epimerase-like enolase superfamily enzyme
LQPYAGLESHTICEFPTELKSLARAMTKNHITPDENGLLHVPDAPGLGIEPDLQGIAPYLVDVQIQVRGETLYCTPPLC